MAEKLKIISLGGLNEIGKNLTVYEYGGDIIVVDCGMGFPDDDMYGIDVVIPDVSYLIKNQNKIRGIFITHGHEDHIGALPYVLRSVNAPIYATRMSAGLIKLKLEEHRLLNKTKLITCEAGDVVKAGRFSVEFIHVNHSIADAVAFAIHTSMGVIIHTGDFKIDSTPIDGDVIDLGRFGELGKEGVLALLAAAKEAGFDKRVCLVFLDNNERTLLGASAFRKKHAGAGFQAAVCQSGLRWGRGGVAGNPLQAQPVGRGDAVGIGSGFPGGGRDAPPGADQRPAVLSLGWEEVQIPCGPVRLPVSGGAGVLHPPPAHEEGHGPP